jgi:hypothetical protein
MINFISGAFKFIFENAQNITYLASAIGIIFVGWELALKFKAEKRLKQASEVEADIKLIKLFTEVMDLAHARQKTIFSEKTLEYLLTKGINLEKDKDYKQLNDNLSDAVFFVYPIGIAAQVAAIAAIYELGAKNKMLRNPALEGLRLLKEIAGIKDTASKFFEKLSKKQN